MTNQNNPNRIFLIEDGFGLFVFFERLEGTRFRNGAARRPEARHSGPWKANPALAFFQYLWYVFYIIACRGPLYWQRSIKQGYG